MGDFSREVREAARDVADAVGPAISSLLRGASSAWGAFTSVVAPEANVRPRTL